MAFDEVEIIPIINLPDISGPTLSTLLTMANPGDPNSKKGDIQLLADIISNQIGTVTVPDPFYYRVDGPNPNDPPSMDGPDPNRNCPDSNLDGLDYSILKWGVGPLRKGIEWQNDIVGGGWRLLDEDFTSGEMYVAFPKPEISNILSAPDAVARFTAGIAFYPADGTIGAGDYRKLIIINGAKNITLPACSAYPVNIALFITTAEGPQRQTTINRSGTDVIYSQAGTVTKFYLSNREYAVLVTDGTKWYVQSCSDMVFKSPYPGYGWLPGINQLSLDGSTYLRADYPKIMDFITALATANPSAVVDGGTWAANRSFWGTGDGSTTFNVPDFRGYFLRSLNMGKSPSIDPDRTAAGTASLPGSPEAASVESHSHGLDNRLLTEGVPGAGPGGPTPGSSGPIATTSAYGGTDTKPVNVGLPLFINY